MADELFTSKAARAAVLDPPSHDDLDATVKAWLEAKCPAGPRPLGQHHEVDVAAAVEAYPYAKGVMADPNTKMPQRQSAVRSAIVLAKPWPVREA